MSANEFKNKVRYMGDTVKLLNDREKTVLKEFFEKFTTEGAIKSLQNPYTEIGQIIQKQFRIVNGIGRAIN